MKIKDIAKLLQKEQNVSIVTAKDICENEGEKCCLKFVCNDCDDYDCDGCQHKDACSECYSYRHGWYVDKIYEGPASQIPLRTSERVIIGIKLGFWKQEYVGKYKKNVVVDRNRMTIRVKET